VKLNRIKLANFRGFHDEAEISFGPHLTVLFGRNGFGKSTVMDAFEWLLHGQIQRYLGDEEGRKEDYVKHVDARQEPWVEVSISDTEQDWILKRERRSKERSELRVRASNGPWMTSDRALEFLTRIDGDVRADSGKTFAFSEPFVGYHLLGQQSIQAFVQADPRTRYARLAPIVGVERYVKLTEVLLQSRRMLSIEMDSVDRLFSAKTDEISALESVRTTLLPDDQIGTKIPASQEWLSDHFATLRANAPLFLRERLPQQLSKDFEASLNMLEQILPSTLFWISARQKELEDRLASLQELGRNLAATVDMYRELSRITSKLDADRKSLEALAAVFEEKQAATREIEQIVDRVTRAGQQIGQEQARCVELTRIQGAFDNQALHLQSLQSDANALEQSLTNSQNTAKDSLEAEQRSIIELRDANSNDAALNESLALADSLIESLDTISSDQDRIREIRKRLGDLKAELLQSSAELLELEQQSKSLELARTTATDRLDKKSSETHAFQRLLAEIRQFVESDSCPVCSTRFESRDVLLERIDVQLSVESPALLSIAHELNSAVSRISDQRQRIQAVQIKRQTLESRVQSDSREIERHETMIADARKRAIDLGILLGADPQEDVEKVRSLREDLRRRKSSSLSKVQELSGQLKDAQINHQRADDDLRDREIQKTRLSAEIAAANLELTKLDDSRLSLGRSLALADLSPRLVSFRGQELAQKRAEVQIELNGLQGRLTATREELKRAQEDLEPHSAQQVKQVNLKASINRSEAANRERAASLGVDLDANQTFGPLADGIIIEIASMAESTRLFDEFRGSVKTGKQKLKLDEQHAKLTILEADLASIDRRRTSLAVAQRLVSDLAERVRKAGELRTQRILTSCAKLTENYYNRIYSHPLWSRLDIGVDDDPSRGGRAQLSMVAHRSKPNSVSISAVEPAPNPISIKYSFSTGQLNLFAMSLVLSLAQQRSSEILSTLMLDEPVQAMDDMRVAELCWVLLQLARTRQIVIATGNDNFVELLFNRALPIAKDVSVVAHRFESMTSRGPQIHRRWRTTPDEKSDLRVA
jgi:DNA repair exonuclease SbcCD ATPase subunit